MISYISLSYMTLPNQVSKDLFYCQIEASFPSTTIGEACIRSYNEDRDVYCVVIKERSFYQVLYFIYTISGFTDHMMIALNDTNSFSCL